ncbi:MAG: 2,3-bisphosphoglycerate-dependent phosphoglycerate mutase [Chlamydiae bacterium]|nr:2,3-bisphosphoglycerate-dependent phosphoglycerate mutase [Chlamydiota bacterium]
MAELVLLRHGESVWNQLNLFTGWVDVPLSTKGIEEALQAGDSLSSISFDAIYVSALIRAQMTAMLVMSRTKTGKVPCFIKKEAKDKLLAKVYDEESLKTLIPVYADEALNERHYGFLQGLNKQATLEKYGEAQFKQWRRSFRGIPPEGESLEMTAQRALPFFKNNIMPHVEKGETALISAHGNSLRAIVMFLENLSEEEVVSLEIPTGKPLRYYWEKGLWRKSSYF